MNPLDMYIAVQTDLFQIFIQKLDFFPLTIRKNNIRKFFRDFSSNCSCRDVELNLNSGEEVFFENRKLFLLRFVEKYQWENS